MYFSKTDHGYLLRVRLSPNSSSVKTLGTTQNADGETFLKVAVNAVPEKGKANEELIAFLAKKLRLPKAAFNIKTGNTDRWKKIAVETDTDIENKLTELMEA